MIRQYTKEDLDKIANDFGGICLSNEYINARTKYCFMCENKHIFYKSFGQIVYARSWCPKCIRQQHKNRDIKFIYLDELNKQITINKDRRFNMSDIDSAIQFKKCKLLYTNNRIKSDPCFRLRRIVSQQIRRALKSQGSVKDSPTWQKLPYTPEQLKDHLESLWDTWMSWDNYGNKPGQWNIDHIIPQSALPYDHMDHKNFLRCWALSNLRPLEASTNARKSNKITYETILTQIKVEK